jgi:4-hydroxy-2-oxoheptanedioate aldolase
MTKDKLARNEVVLGCAISYPDPELIFASAACGFDFVRFEGEHGPMSYLDIEHMVRVAELAGITATARVPANLQDEILHYLDRGVVGLTIPHVRTAEDAAAVVEAGKHFPIGHRGDNYGARVGRYGSGISVAEYYEAVNDETLLIALIEDKEGVDNVEAIVATPGIDAVDVGPFDLAQSMGQRPDSDTVERAVDHVVEVAVSVGKPVGVGTAMTLGDPSSIRHFLEKGCRYFFVSSTAAFRFGADSVMALMRELESQVGGV